jgi:hypothetical protein
VHSSPDPGPAAVPALREALVRRVAAAAGAPNSGERLVDLDVATGLAEALRIVEEVSGSPLPPGVAHEADLPADALRSARTWLGDDADAVLGPLPDAGGSAERGVRHGSDADLPSPADGRDVHDL